MPQRLPILSWHEAGMDSWAAPANMFVRERDASSGEIIRHLQEARKTRQAELAIQDQRAQLAVCAE